MSKLNNYFTSAIAFARPRSYLPRFRNLGRRFLNAVVILTMILPNIAYTVQAAVPQEEISTAKDTVGHSPILEQINNQPDESSYQSPVYTHPEPRKSPALNDLWQNSRSNENLVKRFSSFHDTDDKNQTKVSKLIVASGDSHIENRFVFNTNPIQDKPITTSSDPTAPKFQSKPVIDFVGIRKVDNRSAPEVSVSGINPSEPIKNFPLLKPLGADFAEQNATDWGADGVYSPVTTITDDTENSVMGSASVKFDTNAAFDWWAYYPETRQAGWDLSSYATLSFWVKTENPNPAGFQAPLTIRLGDQETGGYLEFSPTYDLYSQSNQPGGADVTIPLSGNSDWTRSAVGAVSLSNIDYLEFHADTWDTGFIIWLDGVVLDINDDFSSAASVEEIPYSTSINTSTATTAPDDPVLSCLGSTGYKSVWYTYTPSADNEIILTTEGSAYPTAVAVWTGDNPGNLVETACSADEEPLYVSAQAGETYWIEVVQPSYPGGGELQLQIDSMSMVGLRGEYFDNPELDTPPVITRYDETIAFDWSYGSPDPAVPADQFSVRWSGQVTAENTETYTFSTFSDEGVRLWVNDQQIIDNWTSHDQTWDSGNIALEAGDKYDLQLEYFEITDDAEIQLKWSSPSTPQETIPPEQLSALNLEGTTISASEIWMDSGKMGSTITVELLTASGFVVPNQPVSIQVSGGSNSVNGTPVNTGEWVLIGTTDANGVVSADLTTSFSEVKTIWAKSGGVQVQNTGSVAFPSLDDAAFQIILHGETPAPGEEGGVTGTPEDVFSQEPTSFKIRAVDANYQLLDFYSGTVLINLSDPYAQAPTSVDVVDGEATVVVTWDLPTLHTVEIEEDPHPDQSWEPIYGSRALEVLNTLVINDGETVTVDDDRYAVTDQLSSGDLVIPYDDSAWILPGHEILIAAMTGPGIGKYETHQVASIDESSLTLDIPLFQDFDGTNSKVVVQRIPRYPNVLIQSGGTLTAHAWDGSTGGIVYFHVNTLGETIVETGGTISADQLGFRNGEGPGAGGDAGLGQGAGGGGHGGIGGNSTGSGGTFYDAVQSPFIFGSPGGNKGLQGGAGGGIIYIDSYWATIDGVITSNGGYGREDYGGSGGGAGGAITLSSYFISGTGMISVNGGDGAYSGWYEDGGGGAGGRIDLPAGFSGDVQARGGSGQQYGGPGTVYSYAYLNETLTIDNNGHNGNYAGVIDSDVASLSYYTNYLNNQGHLRLGGSSSALTIDDNTFTGDGTATLAVEGTLTAPTVYTVDGYHLSIEGVLSGVQDLLIAQDSGVTLRAETSLFSGVHTFGNVTVQDGGQLRLIPANNFNTTYTDDQPFEFSAANLTIENGGFINADGIGYRSGKGPGAGVSGGLGQGGSGAGHGGEGGNSTHAGGGEYGDLYQPVDLGSGGGPRELAGGRGGGAVHFQISDTLTLNGMITANGGNGKESYGGAGGGSGGSLWINAATFSGNGSLQASGGNGGDSNLHTDGGGGAGGRIAVYADQDSFTGSVLVDGGWGINTGEEGSKYFDHIDPLLSTLTVFPESVTGDGVTEATITVTVLDNAGQPLSGEPVQVAIASGGQAIIDGQTANVGEYVEIGTSDTNGAATATIASFNLGTRSIMARAGDRDLHLEQQDTVNFIPGPVDESTSTVVAAASEAPADGATSVIITVTARDGLSHPIPNLDVTLSATGDAVVTQPTELTDSQGQTTGSVRNGTIESVIVSAAVDGISLGDQASIQFIGADPAAEISGPSEAMAGAEFVQNIQVVNQGNTTANDVSVVLELAAELTFISHTAPAEPSFIGNTYTWDAGTLNAGESLDFTVTVEIDGSVTEGTAMTSTLSVSTTSEGDDPENNTDQSTTTAGEVYNFTTSLSPTAQTLPLGGSKTYTIEIQNQGYLADTYDLSLSGLDSSWVSFDTNPVTVPPGGRIEISLSVEPNGCPSEETLPFDVLVTAAGDGQAETLSGSLTLDQNPSINLEGPRDNATSGSRSVLFSWRTEPATSGILSVYPAGSPGDVQTYSTASGKAHSVEVENLTRYQNYVWSVEANSACGTSTSPERTLTIGSGIVFTDHSQTVSINRDYDQRASVTVYNEDSVEHTLTASILESYDDLIVNFVDSGSVDETITLQPGESINLTLAVHAQDAVQQDYTLTASLTADEGTGTPIEDQATINLDVLFENDYTIQEGTMDPITLGREYTITNNGLTITDLSVTAVKPGTEEPASVYITPNVSHAKLETGESITVTLYPIFTQEDLEQSSMDSAGHLAAMRNAAASIDYEFLARTGSGGEQSVSGVTECETGKDLYPVTMTGCVYKFENNDWYCTNRPEISIPLVTPYFIKEDSIESLNLVMNFTPHSDVQPHNGQIYFNDYVVESFANQIPAGSYTYSMDQSLLNTTIAGMATQNLQLSTQHPNQGHYVSNTGNTLEVGINSVSFLMCGASQAEAQQAAEEQYPCNAGSSDEPATDILNEARLYGGEVKASLGNAGEVCPVVQNPVSGTQGTAGDPINSQTGAFSFSRVDLSVPIQSCNLAFQPVYSSAAIDEPLDGLGYGWTHNHALKLIFPDDPGGKEGFVLYQGITGNRSLFFINGDGSFSAGPGVMGTLTKNDGPPTTYTIESSNQKTLIFNEDGKILSRVDALGFGIDYNYDVNGRLEKVEANDGSRYLDFAYDASDHIVMVTDHDGRSVGYAYDANGDLVTTTDVMGEDWSYTYDSEHRMTSFTDPRGVDTVQTDYDMQGRAFRQHDGEGNLLVEIVFHSDGTSTVYDGLGNAQTHQYDNRNTLVDQVDPLGGSIDKAYDANFRPETITDQEGNTTTLSWSADGANLTQVEDADGNVTGLGYDSLNNLTSVTDAQNNLTTYSYTGTLMDSVTDVFGETTSYTYTPEGWVETVTDPLGNTTSYGYDSIGQMTSMTDPLGNTTTYSYDNLGRLIDTTDPIGKVTHNDFNAAGQLVKVTENYDPGRPQNDQNEYNIVTEYLYDKVGNRTAVIDTYGNTTTYTYNNNNQLLAVTDPQGNTTSHAYDVNSNRVSTTDALGRTTTFTYDDLNRLVSTTDALGQTTSTSYNPDGTVDFTSDTLGRKTYYTYDNLQRVTATTDPLNGVTGTAYDDLGNVTSTTDALGRVTNYEYDALGRLIRTTDPEGGVTEHFYDIVGNRVQTVDPMGNATTYTYDVLGRVETVTDAQGNTTSYTYNEVGQRETVTDPLGNVTTYTYDSLGRQISVTDPAGNTSTTTYDALGRVTASTDALGRTTTSTYDVLGRLISRTNPAGGVTSFTYDAVGNQLSVTDPNGHTTTTSYDALNRPAAVTDPNGNTTTTSYNAVGNVVSTTNPAGETMSFAYDAAGRQTSITDPLGETIQYIYDAVGNRTSLVAADGVTTRYEYDGLNRLTAVVENYRPGFNPDHETNVRTKYSYDANGNRLSITDGRNNTTTFTYTNLNQLETETDPLGNTWAHSYDARGNLTSLIDANGVTTNYAYDALGRRTDIDYPGTEEDVHFDYNAVGQPLEMNDAVGTTTWSYDTLGRIASVNDPFGDTVGYSYDAVGNRTGLTYPDGKQVSYSYDPANQLTGVTDWASRVTSYSYDPVGRLLSRALPNGVISDYDYDLAGQLTSLVHQAGGDVLSSFLYTYDAVGNRTQVVETLGTMEAGPTVTITVTDDTGSPLVDKTVYVFDGIEYTGYSESTDAAGQAEITLPEGDYRFRVDVDGTEFWSGETDHCAIAGCTQVMVTVPSPVLVTVQDSAGTPREGLSVYAFSGEEYSDFSGTTDEDGQVSLRLPEGDYRFRADFNGTQFWSGDEDHCTISGCTLADIEVSLPLTVTVVDNIGVAREGLKVYAFDGETYTNFNSTTDAQGQVVFTLPKGDYRFRADFNGTEFWSGDANHCSVPGCQETEVMVSRPVSVAVADTDGGPAPGLKVYAFEGSSYSGFNGTTDANGEVELTLPEGDYRFRADFNGTEFWSDDLNHCTVPGCENASVAVTKPVTVTVNDTDGAPQEGLQVYTYDGSTYQGFSGTTNAVGEVIFTLPEGDYRFRADFNGTQFWSGETNHCSLPGCETAAVTVTPPVTVSVLDWSDAPQDGVKVYAFDGTSFSGYSGTTDSAGEVDFTLPVGGYRFRADFEGEQYWSSPENNCTLPGCLAAEVRVGPEPTATPTATATLTLTATATLDITTTPSLTPELTPSATPQETPSPTVSITPVPTTLTPTETFSATVSSTPVLTATATSSGTEEVDPTYTLEITETSEPVGTPTPSLTPTVSTTATEEAFLSSGSGLALAMPYKVEEEILFDPDPSVVVSVSDTDGSPQDGVPVYAFDGETYTGEHGTTDAAGEVVLNLPDGSYRFRADVDGTQFWSGETSQCTVPDCSSASVTVTKPITLSVSDIDGTPQEGLKIYAFSGGEYSGYSGTTDAEGESFFRLPAGDYRFRADLNGTQFWSGADDHCTLPGCETAAVEVTRPILVSVADTDGTPKEGLKVYAFDGETYSGYSGTTDTAGEVSFTLTGGDYRFRADLNSTQFWSGGANHCTLPGCETAVVEVTKPILVSVNDTDGTPQENLTVYAFDGDTYTGYSGSTDAVGEVSFTLPAGDYRFRADFNGTKFWSGGANHCTLPGCEAAAVTVTVPVTVTVAGENGDPYPDLDVYAFDGETYTGFHGVSDENGEVAFTLPEGDYRFRADYDGVQFWSNTENHCAVPGCTEAGVAIPGGLGHEEITIDYTYDPLNRLTAADYSDETFFHYQYDAVGNRLQLDSSQDGVVTYQYDAANRLIEAGGVAYTWDANGNLLSDGTSTYTYNHANRLAGVTQDGVTYSYAYNGMGDRLVQTVDGVTTNYTLDLNTGLTQVLADGTHSYLYGQGRIVQEDTAVEYFLGDALNSVRQLVDGSSAVTLTQNYEPYGSVLSSTGEGESIFNFTGEIKDSYIKLVYLRSRYMSVDTGRFTTKDVWDGDYNTPMSYNNWLYVNGNPVNFTDPSGEQPDQKNNHNSLPPCDEDLASTYRYCIFRGGMYNGFFVDMTHLRASRDRARNILTKLADNIGNEITFPVGGRLIGISFNRWYHAFLPDDATSSMIENEGLGILMNFETNIERIEFIDPSCLFQPSAIFTHRCSTYSNEDLPSAYLGFSLRAKRKDFNWLLSELDGNNGNSYMSNVFPSDYAGTALDAKRCFFGDCDDDNPYNRCFNPKVLDALKDNYVYLKWPDELNDFTPTSEYWRVATRPIRR